MIKFKNIFVFLLFMISVTLFSQGEIDEQEKIFYRNERTLAFLLNSNGIGGNFRYAKRLDAFRKTLYEIEFDHVKHPKESKLSVPSSQSLNRNIVYGKLNYFYTLKGAIGFQKELFRKEDKGGISIRYFYNIGPSIGLLKPIYYYVTSSTSSDEVNILRFDQQQHPQIQGKAPFSKGLNEISVIPGVYGKFGFSFEFSKLDEVYHAIEGGIAIDAYVKKVPLMAIEKNQQIIVSLFISYRFGKVINAQFKNRKTAVDDLLD